MNKRAEVKDSEARILVFLATVHNSRKYANSICSKLNIDYSYGLRILSAMTAKGWLNKHYYQRKAFYDLSPIAPLESAKKAYEMGELQRTLEETCSLEEKPPLDPDIIPSDFSVKEFVPEDDEDES